MSATTRETEWQGHSGCCWDETRKALLSARSLPASFFVPTQQHWDLRRSAQPVPPPTAFACLAPSALPQLPLGATRPSGAPRRGQCSTPAALLRVAVPGLTQLHQLTVCDEESDASTRRKGRQRGDNAEQFQVGRTSVSDSLLYLPANHCVIFPREDFRKARKTSILHSPKATSTPLGRSSRFGLGLLSPSPLPH